MKKWLEKVEKAKRENAENLALICDDIRDISALGSLSGLKKLELSWCNNMEDISALSSLTNLTFLSFYGCHSIKDFSSVSALTKLTYLKISSCGNLKDLQFLSSLQNLKELDLSGCRYIENLSPISALTKLTYLKISFCDNLKDLQFLSSLQNLKELDLSDCRYIENLSPISSCRNLEKLNLNRCKFIEDISPLCYLSNLKQLNLNECSSIKVHAPLASLRNLQELTLVGFPNIKNINVFSWRYLKSVLFGRMRDMSSLCYLSNLERLVMFGNNLIETVVPKSSIIELHRDERGRLHNDKGPSILCREGLNLYHWHGVGIPRRWITESLPSPKEALAIRNIERRRVACEMIGWANIIKDLDAKIIDENPDPEIGTLLEVVIPIPEGAAVGEKYAIAWVKTTTNCLPQMMERSGYRERFLKVRCGTGREFVIPVPQDMQTARQANAWTYGLEANEYHPEVRT